MGEAAKIFRRLPQVSGHTLERDGGYVDKLIHGYSGVDSHKVWLVIRDYLPHLKTFIIGMLQDFKN
jgi:uncharacterized protein with HEPN domain